MRISSDNDYDGKDNMRNAIIQALDVHPYNIGVFINFAGKIHSPEYVYKHHSYDLDPFTSGKFGEVGIIHYDKINWLNNPPRSEIITIPQDLQSVPIIYAHPGATSNYLDGYLGRFKSIIVVGYGCGNVSEHMYNAISNVMNNCDQSKKISVILVTNCRYGGIREDYAGNGGI